VQVREQRAARGPDRHHRLAGLDRVADLHLQAGLMDVAQDAEQAVGVADDDIVAEQGVRGLL
jgi:hypothetical protein